MSLLSNINGAVPVHVPQSGGDFRISLPTQSNSPALRMSPQPKLFTGSSDAVRQPVVLSVQGAISYRWIAPKRVAAMPSGSDRHAIIPVQLAAGTGTAVSSSSSSSSSNSSPGLNHPIQPPSNLSSSAPMVQAHIPAPPANGKGDGRQEEEDIISPIFNLIEDVWLCILEWMSEPRDVMNTFRALPHLQNSNVFKRIQNLYLFDQILPLIAPMMDSKSILNCRLVCRMWASAVNNYAEDHPAMRPCQSDVTQLNREQNWIGLIAHKNPLQHFPGFKPTILRSASGVKKLVKQFRVSPKRCPFFGNNVVLKPLRNTNGNTFWSAAISLFESYGLHITHLTIPVQTEQCDWIKNMTNILQCTGSLRSLTLTALEGGSDEGPDFNPMEFLLHHKRLGQLETIKIESSAVSVPFVVQALDLYAGVLMRIDINLATSRRSFQESRFRGLVHLTITAVGKGSDVEELLQILHAPQLHTLMIEFDEHKRLDTERVTCSFPSLIRFPHLQNLHILHSSLLRTPGGIPFIKPVFVIPSIRLLELWPRESWGIYDINDGALRCYPSLQYLKIAAGNVNMHQLWRLLPQLKEATLIDRQYFRVKHMRPLNV